jgi:hypothetical protein
MDNLPQEIDAGKRAVNAVTPELIEKVSDSVAVMLNALELSEGEIGEVVEAIKRKSISNIKNQTQ